MPDYIGGGRVASLRKNRGNRQRKQTAWGWPSWYLFDGSHYPATIGQELEVVYLPVGPNETPFFSFLPGLHS